MGKELSKKRPSVLGLLWLLCGLVVFCGLWVGCTAPKKEGLCVVNADCSPPFVCTLGVCTEGTDAGGQKEVVGPEGADGAGTDTTGSDAGDEQGGGEQGGEQGGGEQGTTEVVDVPPIGDPECVENDTRPCYAGPDGTKGLGACKEGTETCRNGRWSTCEGEVLPKKEECNGQDDDCDGEVDEEIEGIGDLCRVPDAKGPCAGGKKACEQGTLSCVSDVKPVPEICGNGIDEDCDGQADSAPCVCTPGETAECYNGPQGTGGVGACVKGKRTCDNDAKWTACQGQVFPQTEECNGKDDDCNGQVDESFPEKGKACTDTTKKGECQAGLYERCEQGKLVCVSNVQPKTENCGNAKDDDCDGEIDENPPCACNPGQKRSCYTGKAGTEKNLPCKVGGQTCDSTGSWSACTGEVVPKTETCSGVDDDCDGKVDGITRTCYTGATGTSGVGLCKSGIETCTAGKWGTCTGEVKPATETCNNKDDDCDGAIDGQTRSCYSGAAGTAGKGVCKAGVQSCTAGAWGTCAGEVKPTTETCNGQDDDCDGSVDESLTRSCYTGPTGTAGKGICKTGTQTCASGAWGTCAGQVLPKAEACNNQDDDCDGSIDEGVTRACYTGPAGTSGVGLCRPGTQSCSAGQWATTCSGQRLPAVERCDSLDNDCDNRTDEICGRSHDYAYISTTGTLSYNRGFNKASRSSTGLYTATTPGNQKCTDNPAFVTVRTTAMRPISWSCTNRDYRISIGATATRTGARANDDFYIVLPLRSSGEVWGQVNATTTTATLATSYGAPTVRRVAAGVYEITSTRCSSATQPVFASIYSTGVVGYATGFYYTSGRCRVHTYNLNGAAADRSFSFWIPYRTQNAWAMTSSTGAIYSSNYFGDQTARWTSTNVSATAYSYTNVTFPGWSTRSAVLINHRVGLPYYTPANPITNGIRAYSRTIPTNTAEFNIFSVLFVRP